MATADAMRKMLALGMPIEQALEVIEAFEIQAVDARKERNRRYYQKAKASEKRLNSDGTSEMKDRLKPSEKRLNSDAPRATSFLTTYQHTLPGVEGSEVERGSEVVARARPGPDETQQAFDDWNTLARMKGLPEAERLTPARRTKLRCRLDECGGLDGWRGVLNRVARSAFLTGDNDRGWRANLDFMLQQSSFTKLREGVYDRGDKPLRGTAALAEQLKREIENEGYGSPEGSDFEAGERLAITGGKLH